MTSEIVTDPVVLSNALMRELMQHIQNMEQDIRVLEDKVELLMQKEIPF
jgi:hypothetical protein